MNSLYFNIWYHLALAYYLKQDFEKAFEGVDMIACPSAPTTAFEIGAHKGDPLAMYLEDIFTLPASLAGVPGISFPVGFDAKGLPVGLQLIAQHFREDILLRTTHIYQQTTNWHKQAPSLDAEKR